MHESGGGRESDAVTLLASGQTQRQRYMSFASAGGAERNTVVAFFDPFTARQFQNQRFVLFRSFFTSAASRCCPRRRGWSGWTS